MSAAQQVSADLLQWQLDTTIREEPYLDYTIPLQQMNGVNVTVVEGLTLAHPLASDQDAVNYLAALAQVEARMDEAIARSRRLAATGDRSSGLHPAGHHQTDAQLRGRARRHRIRSS